MTFKHKLAKRLAMIRDTAGLLPAAAILACTAGDQAVSGPTQPSFLSSASNLSTILFQETFADTAFAARGWYDNPSMVTTTAQHIPGSTAALEAHFPVVAPTGKCASRAAVLPGICWAVVVTMLGLSYQPRAANAVSAKVSWKRMVLRLLALLRKLGWVGPLTA